MAKVRVLAFGGCNLRAPIVRARHRRKQAEPTAWSNVPRGYRTRGPLFFTYTVGEMEQAVACYRGEKSLPDEMLVLCGMTPETAPSPAISFLKKADVVLVEPNTSVEFVLDGYHIGRRPLLRLLHPLRSLGLDAARLSVRWFEKGVAGLDHDARRSDAAALIAMIPEDFPSRALIVRVLADLTPFRPPVRDGLRRLVNSLRPPVGIVLFAWSYMPDGRPLSWPADFLGEVSDAANELGLPVFDPRPLVQAAGVEVALASDRRHYADSFMPTIAAPLVEFMLATAALRQSRRGSRRRGGV